MVLTSFGSVKRTIDVRKVINELRFESNLVIKPSKSVTFDSYTAAGILSLYDDVFELRLLLLNCDRFSILLISLIYYRFDFFCEPSFGLIVIGICL